MPAKPTARNDVAPRAAIIEELSHPPVQGALSSAR